MPYNNRTLASIFRSIRARHRTVQPLVAVSQISNCPYLGSSDETLNSNSSYQSLQAEVRRQFAHGLLFRANFTFSKSLDVSDTGGGTQEANAPPLLTEPWNLKAD